MAPVTAPHSPCGVLMNLCPIQSHLQDEMGLPYCSSEQFEPETEQDITILRLLTWKPSAAYLLLPDIHILPKNAIKLTLRSYENVRESAFPNTFVVSS